MNVIILQKYQIDTDTFVSIFEYIMFNKINRYLFAMEALIHFLGVKERQRFI